MKTSRAAGFLVAFAGLALAGEQTLGAQRAQLRRIALGMANGGGYVETHDPQTGSLRDGRSVTFPIQLDPGMEYVFRGTCDRDCSDLDLELLNRNGDVIDSDFALDDVPEVGVRTQSGGWFRVRVTMASCSIEPCAYAVGTFGR